MGHVGEELRAGLRGALGGQARLERLTRAGAGIALGPQPLGELDAPEIVEHQQHDQHHHQRRRGDDKGVALAHPEPLAARRQQLGFVGVHRPDDTPHLVHRALAGARSHESDGSRRFAAALQRNDLVEQSQALGEHPLEARQTGRFDRIVGRERPHARQRWGHYPQGAFIGAEIGGVASEEGTALSQLRVLRRAEQVVERVDDVVRVAHPATVVDVARRAAVPGRAHDGEDRHDHRESDLYLAREALGS